MLDNQATQIDCSDMQWEGVVNRIAPLLCESKVVASIGCFPPGLMGLLFNGVEFVSIGSGLRFTGDFSCNFMEYRFPPFYADVVILYGNIEGILDVNWLIEQVANHADGWVIILCPIQERSLKSLSERVPINCFGDLSAEGVISRFNENGFAVDILEVFSDVQLVVFKRSNRRNPYGVLVYPTQLQNLGDYTQAAAVASITGRPEDAVFLPREDLHHYRGKPLPVICNGWFAHDEVFPPADRLVPLYISLHIANHARPWFSTSAMLDHLRRYAPIGCRDKATMDFLVEQDVPAYFSHCVTLGLGLHIAQSPGVIAPVGDRVYLIDPPVVWPKKRMSFIGLLFKGLTQPRLLRSGWLFAQAQRNPARRGVYSLLFAGMYGPLIKKLGADKVVCESQYMPLGQGSSTCSELLGRAMTRLETYRQARAVITSRIHVAIPARAAGAQVVFVRPCGLSTQEYNRIQDHEALFTARIEICDGRAPVDAIENAVNDHRPPEIEGETVAALVAKQTQQIHAFLADFDRSGWSSRPVLQPSVSDR